MRSLCAVTPGTHPRAFVRAQLVCDLATAEREGARADAGKGPDPMMRLDARDLSAGIVVPWLRGLWWAAVLCWSTGVPRVTARVDWRQLSIRGVPLEFDFGASGREVLMALRAQVPADAAGESLRVA